MTLSQNLVALQTIFYANRFHGSGIWMEQVGLACVCSMKCGRSKGQMHVHTLVASAEWTQLEISVTVPVVTDSSCKEWNLFICALFLLFYVFPLSPCLLFFLFFCILWVDCVLIILVGKTSSGWLNYSSIYLMEVTLNFFLAMHKLLLSETRSKIKLKKNLNTLTVNS
jgi:hypothetical protein